MERWILLEDKIFEHSVRLYYNDFDRYRKVKVSSLLHLMSDTAGIHYTGRGYSYDWMKEQNQVFLLSAMRFVKESEPMQDEIITVKTFEGDIKGAAFIRYFDLLGADGRTLVQAASSWMLVNPISRKLIRPKDFIGTVDALGVEREELHPQRLKPQTETLSYTEHSERTVRFSDIDRNDHLYNAKYADMIYDALPQEYTQKNLTDFQIHYRSEAYCGDQLRIGYEQKEDGLYVIGSNIEKGEICFAAKLQF